ncbi:hypothetical protein L1987_58856 [Smallanthus sonchifolius]|uniref:Uncharacterized protein n=1 Tax=Smallanthus sonchifolius TaxID=185202 RepID=A0ACB9D3L5_9ASTR|nr:hypothetical protein L1987_58856 [Smallanthus sonchifolius]
MEKESDGDSCADTCSRPSGKITWSLRSEMMYSRWILETITCDTEEIDTTRADDVSAVVVITVEVIEIKLDDDGVEDAKAYPKEEDDDEGVPNGDELLGFEDDENEDEDGSSENGDDDDDDEVEGFVLKEKPAIVEAYLSLALYVKSN